MNSRLVRPTIRSTVVVLTLALVPAVLLAPPVSAGHVFAAKWGTVGSGDGQFSSPRGVATDPAGNVYVADTANNRVQKFTSSGNFIAKWGTLGSGDGQFNSPRGIATDASGNVYVADTNNHRVQMFSSTGNFITKWGALGSGNGQFNTPGGIAIAPDGDVYVADTLNDRVQVFSPSGEFWITKWGAPGSGDGQFNDPYGIATDPAGNVYVADTGNHRIQKFTASGDFITKWGALGSGDGQFSSPFGVATDASGRVYVADQSNNRVQKFTSSGDFITKWGTSGSGYGQFANPGGIGTDASGNVYVVEVSNYRIQQFLVVAPNTFASGPSGLINDPTPAFTFTSTPAGADFECRVKGSGIGFVSCPASYTAPELEDGLNILVVRAVDSELIVDPTPADHEFRVDASPPQTFIDSAPRTTKDKTPTFGFSSTERGTFKCSIDGKAFASCASPLTTSQLSTDSHTFRVRATDRAGNVDPTPATAKFTILES